LLLTADRIYNGKQWLPSGSAIEVAEDGTIVAIHEQASNTEAIHYSGVITPGFVNVHCHLELSHMKDVIPQHTGLIPFLQQVMQKRGIHSEEEKKVARHAAFQELRNNGVVAVGDIANTFDTSDLRSSGAMHFHTFVEAIGFNPQPQKQFDYALHVYEQFKAQHQPDTTRLSQSIVPHAPYSISQAMFTLIDKHDSSSILSIHNQESKAEDEFYLLKKGTVRELLSSLGINDEFFIPSGKSSLQTYLQWISNTHPVIFVHNTYTTLTDVEVANTLINEVYWCLCPKANLYIENTVPDVPMFIKANADICIGTDSLSSNTELSILSELKTIKRHFPSIDWEQLLKWGTYNGAKALRLSDIVGSIEPGKKPGLVHISSLNGDSSIKVIA
jgi:cytosine/adenosine deaminase-related metal-dependent hydrolase